MYPIADAPPRWHKAKMERRLVVIAVIALCGCGPSRNVTAGQGLKAEARPLALPFDNSTGFLDGYSLRVPRSGAFLWNGQSVDNAVLQDFLRQNAAMPRDAGPIFVAFEPGVTQARADWVRRQVINSGLCEQRRCAEVGWDVKRPVAN
jgi:hypothetical protein